MSRPGEWHLLGVDGDPLPGDAYDVQREARNYSSVATAIAQQVDRLRHMSSGSDELVGKYAPELEESAKDLAENLGKAHHRFEVVGQQLTIWHPVLDQGLTDTLSYLHQAEHAQQTIDANKPPSGPPPTDPTDEQKKAAQRRDKAHGDAVDELGRIVSRFNDCMDDIHRTSKSVASAIKHASDDDLKDSWWDKHVRKWIHDHAELLKLIADVLTFIATALAIAALFITGVGAILLILAAVATVGALLIHTALAANGDGSWVDVALDVVALVTLGAGAAFTSAARGARAAYVAKAGLSAADSAFSATATTGRIFVAGEDGLTITKGITNLSQASEAFTTTLKAVQGTKIAELPAGLKLLTGDGGVLTNDLLKIGTEFGDSPLITQGVDAAMKSMRLYQAGLGVDVTAKVFNDAFGGAYPGIKPWPEWKEEHTVHSLPSWLGFGG